MPRISWQEQFAACACVAILVFIAFFGAYAGDESNKPAPSRGVENQRHVSEPNSHDQSTEANPDPNSDVVKVVTQSAAEHGGESKKTDANSDYGSAAEWRLNELTLWLVVVTFVMAVIAGAQAVMFFLQLRYMHDGMKDAATASRAAETAAKAAEQSNIISRELFVLEQRPWVKIIGPPEVDMIITSQSIQITVLITVENIGKTVAFKTYVDTEMFCHTGGNTTEVAFKKFCKKIIEDRGNTRMAVGNSIFPNEQLHVERIVSYNNAEVEKGIIGEHIWPVIFVSASYFLSDGSDFRCTAFVIDLRDSKGRGMFTGFDLGDKSKIGHSKRRAYLQRLPIYELIN